eukprot:5110074-Pyramimonas_sp.AAC.1
MSSTEGDAGCACMCRTRAFRYTSRTLKLHQGYTVVVFACAHRTRFGNPPCRELYRNPTGTPPNAQMITFACAHRAK